MYKHILLHIDETFIYSSINLRKNTTKGIAPYSSLSNLMFQIIVKMIVASHMIYKCWFHLD